MGPYTAAIFQASPTSTPQGVLPPSGPLPKLSPLPSSGTQLLQSFIWLSFPPWGAARGSSQGSIRGWRRLDSRSRIVSPPPRESISERFSPCVPCTSPCLPLHCLPQGRRHRMTAVQTLVDLVGARKMPGERIMSAINVVLVRTDRVPCPTHALLPVMVGGRARGQGLRGRQIIPNRPLMPSHDSTHHGQRCTGRLHGASLTSGPGGSRL